MAANPRTFHHTPTHTPNPLLTQPQATQKVPPKRQSARGAGRLRALVSLCVLCVKAFDVSCRTQKRKTRTQRSRRNAKGTEKGDPRLTPSDAGSTVLDRE